MDAGLVGREVCHPRIAHGRPLTRELSWAERSPAQQLWLRVRKRLEEQLPGFGSLISLGAPVGMSWTTTFATEGRRSGRGQVTAQKRHRRKRGQDARHHVSKPVPDGKIFSANIASASAAIQTRSATPAENMINMSAQPETRQWRE